MVGPVGAGTGPSSSGQACGLSGVVVGMSVDLLNCDTFTNLLICGVDVVPQSGPLLVGVQTSDTDVSGNFTDPTSGMSPQLANWPFPTVFQSGGMVVLNSGGTGGTFTTFRSGHAIASGFFEAAGFLRPHRYARALFVSGTAGAGGNQYVGALQVGFVGQQQTTGSGGGFYTTSGIGAPPTV